jgi:hypothetical protein
MIFLVAALGLVLMHIGTGLDERRNWSRICALSLCILLDLATIGSIAASMKAELPGWVSIGAGCILAVGAWSTVYLLRKSIRSLFAVEASEQSIAARKNDKAILFKILPTPCLIAYLISLGLNRGTHFVLVVSGCGFLGMLLYVLVLVGIRFRIRFVRRHNQQAAPSN